MNKQTTQMIVLISLLVVGLIGCAPTGPALEPAAAPSEATAVVAETAPTLLPAPTRTAKPVETVEEETAADGKTVVQENAMPLPNDPTAQKRIQQATDDLAERLAVSTDHITLVAYETVTWRDGSLGCPLPGMAYTQALQDGYRIQLQAGDQQYDYHGSRGEPFLCESAGKTDPAPSSDS